ncbi:hypothetical protein GGS24DRAFT_483281 [Hypoxylon argillaceum]|nr:hypothetical protein GGS24DRAFT_483281 [Hypoxylon argillaceum]
MTNHYDDLQSAKWSRSGRPIHVSPSNWCCRVVLLLLLVVLSWNRASHDLAPILEERIETHKTTNSSCTADATREVRRVTTDLVTTYLHTSYLLPLLMYENHSTNRRGYLIRYKQSNKNRNPLDLHGRCWDTEYNQASERVLGEYTLGSSAGVYLLF